MLVEKQTNDMIGNWIESMRLRTLPVSVAGVIAGCACSILMDSFRLIPALLCLVFAVLAQIAANFGNEYYDFKHGIDKKGREGFRRGVTEGEIAPESMKTATFVTLAAAAAVGCAMLCYGPWWLVLVGMLILILDIQIIRKLLVHEQLLLQIIHLKREVGNRIRLEVGSVIMAEDILKTHGNRLMVKHIGLMRMDM